MSMTAKQWREFGETEAWEELKQLFRDDAAEDMRRLKVTPSRRVGSDAQGNPVPLENDDELRGAMGRSEKYLDLIQVMIETVGEAPPQEGKKDDGQGN